MIERRSGIGVVLLAAAVLLLAACAAPVRGQRYGHWSYVETKLDPFWWTDVIALPQARLKAGTGEGAVVAIVGTGLLTGHEDIAFVSPGEATCGSKPADTNDANGHGTQLAGIAAGRDPGHNTRGVAPGARVIPIKIDCGVVTADALTKGVDAAIARTPDVILIAIGGYPAPDVSAFMASRVAGNPGILFVVASVWDGSAQFPFPAWTQLGNALVVAAMTFDADENDRTKSDTRKEIPYSSRRGHIWAPGRNVGTADKEEEGSEYGRASASPATRAPTSHAQYLMNGTSPAAAAVAGCAALVKGKTGLTGAAIRSALDAGAEPKPDLPGRGERDTSNKRLNCARALP